MKRIFLFVCFLVLWSAPVFGALTYDQSYYARNTGTLGAGNTNDPLYNLWGTLEGLYEGTSAFDAIRIIESTGATYYTKLAGGNQSANLTLTLPTAYAASSGYVLSSTDAGVLSWVANGGTFTGGAVTSDVNMADTMFIDSGTTATNTTGIRVYDVDNTVNREALLVTAGNTPAIALGNTSSTLAIASTGGLNVTTAGVVTGVTDLTATGAQTINTSGTGATNIGTGTYTGTITLGNNSATLAFASSALDVSSAGAVSGVTTLSLSDDITMATGKGVKSSTTTAQSVGVYGYDTDGSYVGALVVTNSATPATVLGNVNGTTAISSSGWTVSTAGAMTTTGLLTASGGETLTGTVSINDSATTSTTSIGGGTTTGAVSIGTGAGAQSLSLGTGAAAKTTAVGSSNTTSTTTILGGDNGVNINADNLNNPTNINTSGSTGTVTIGGTGIMTINIGQGGTGAKTITIGDAASTGSITVQAGTGDLALTSVDDVSLNGGSAGSLVNVGTNTQGNLIHIGDNDTTADTITIGSAKDTSSLAGISVTVGSTGTTSATAIQSGSGGVNVNASNNQPTNIGTGTTTGTVTIGSAAAQTINIGDGAAAKAVTLGSNNTTSTTTLLSGDTAAALSLNASAGGAVTNIGTGTTTGTVTIGGSATQAIAIGNGLGAKAVTLGSKTGASATIVQSGSADLDLDAAGAIDVDAVSTFDVLAGGAFSIDGSNAASNITLATNTDADDFTIGLTGATNSSIIFNSTGTGADSIGFVTSAGGISVANAAAMKIGDGGSANYSNFAGATGLLTFVGTARPTKSIYLPMQQFTALAGTPVLTTEIGTNQGIAMAFDAATEEGVSTSIFVPEDWAAGTDVSLYVYWCSSDATGTTHDVVWDVNTIAIASDEACAGTLIVDSVTDALISDTAYDLNVSQAIVVGASTEWAAGDMVTLLLFRDADAAADDATGDALVFGIKMSYTSDEP